MANALCCNVASLWPWTRLWHCNYNCKRAHFEEGLGNATVAAAGYESLLNQNPTRLGVVRAAADFHWRQKNYARTLAILQQAAGKAHPQLATSLRFEVAGKANESGNYALAASIAKEFLANNPLDERAATLLVDGYSRQGNDAAVATHYQQRLELISAATIPQAEKLARIDTLRRNLIPALVRRNDAPAAIDQYIELLKRYPEDTALANEASQYAQRTQQQERLLAYFRKAETDSPRDARWPIVRARLEAAFGNYNESLLAWERAAKLRPERMDLASAKADLELRLTKLDAAFVSYQKLYELSYQNPQWLLKMAELRARQKNGPQVVTLLRKLFVDERPDRAAGLASMADKLLQWGMVTEAQTAATQALAASPGPNTQFQVARVFAKAQARTRQYADLNVRLAALQGSAEGRAAVSGPTCWEPFWNKRTSITRPKRSKPSAPGPLPSPPSTRWSWEEWPKAKASPRWPQECTPRHGRTTTLLRNRNWPNCRRLADDLANTR